MKLQNYQSASLNSFDFSFKTSSGDEINLKMYDNKTVDYASAKTAGASASALTLTHEYGYSFSYKGDGLDARDKEELAAALEKIAPSIDKFIKNVKEGEDPIFSRVTNLANSLRKELPEVKDANHKNFIADGTLKLFDRLMEQNKAGSRLLQNSKKLFDELISQLDSFKFYV
nr:ATP/GTP-binding protein [uncultured Campylobacter sp.]